MEMTKPNDIPEEVKTVVAHDVENKTFKITISGKYKRVRNDVSRDVLLKEAVAKGDAKIVVDLEKLTIICKDYIYENVSDMVMYHASKVASVMHYDATADCKTIVISGKYMKVRKEISNDKSLAGLLADGKIKDITMDDEKLQITCENGETFNGVMSTVRKRLDDLILISW